MRADDLNTRLGRNIHLIRSDKQLSQERLAHLCGLHRTYIGAIERGDRNVTLNTVAKIAAALEVDSLDLLQELEQCPQEPPATM